MRLNRLDLARYGRFTDRSLDFPAPQAGGPDLHVIFGPNEAGKSTLFSAWLDLLYGIPLQTRYSFLHQGPALRIGARLDLGSGPLEVARIKRGLLDGADQPLPEAALQGALAGLGREAYGAMFSLDDDTLERGGDAILSSRGELGAMLFSASAGLAGLSPRLEVLRRELDGFHKPGGRKTAVKAARDALADLDRQSRALDVTAGMAQRLKREAEAAEKAWRAAGAEEAVLRGGLDTLRAGLALVPQRARLARLQADLAPLADLPEASADDEARLRRIEAGLAELSGEIAARTEALADTMRQRDGLARDGAVLALSEAIEQAAGLQAPHATALKDLPNRRHELAELRQGMALRMAGLGLGGRPEDHALAPPLLARLRQLAGRRDVLRQAMERAATEAQRAADRLAEAGQRLGEAGADLDPAALVKLLADIRARDPEAALLRAGQEAAARAGDLAAALQALEPWRGGPQDLAALPVPPSWQRSAWEAQTAAQARALAEAAQDLGTRRAECEAARRALQAVPGEVPSRDEAAQARQRREAAWALHLARLDARSAAAFEIALRLDDQTALDLAEALSRSRRAVEDRAALARAEAQLAAAEADLDARARESQALADDISGALGALGLAGAGLADLANWLALRERALAAMRAAESAAAAQARAQDTLHSLAEALAPLLDLPATLGLPRLVAEAQGQVDRARAAQGLADLRRDSAARAAEAEATRAALATWQAEWDVAAAGTGLQPVEGLAARLDALDGLGQDLLRATDLALRITKMEANSQAFRHAAAALFAALQMPIDTDWPALPDRLARARAAEETFQRLSDDLARHTALQAAAQARAALVAADRQALGAALGWDGTGALADHLARCRSAAQLRAELGDLQAELSRHPGPDEDAGLLQDKVDALELRLTLARTVTEESFAALTAARAALQAVGADDAVARLAATRANLLARLREDARAHLGLRLALTSFDAGLRRYRESHRSAMLARASDAFQRLSCGAYVGLAAQPDGAGEVLVARPALGGAKLAPDLSKGTRFQLYLALRIAGYHEMAKSRPPVPFIADDIMETFDDARAGAAFGLLAEMSRTGQVIYLTHHRHLCDIALAACPGARLLDLGAPLQT